MGTPLGLFAGDLEGFVASAWDPLSVFPVVQGIKLVAVGVHTVDHSVHRRAGAAVGGAMGCGCAFAVRGAASACLQQWLSCLRHHGNLSVLSFVPLPFLRYRS